MQPRTKALFDRAVLRATPLVVDLHAGPVGIWGSREECLAIARSLVCQLTTLSGPADFRLAVATDESRAEDWRFTAWLPHTQTGSTNPPRTIHRLRYDTGDVDAAWFARLA